MLDACRKSDDEYEGFMDDYEDNELSEEEVFKRVGHYIRCSL